jgi:hypothetical protein
LLEKRPSVIEASTANTWVNISSAECNCIYFVRVLAIQGIVETIVYFGVGVEGVEEVIEVWLICTVSNVLTIVLGTCLRLREYCLMSSEYENGREEENKPRGNHCLLFHLLTSFRP